MHLNRILAATVLLAQMFAAGSSLAAQPDPASGYPNAPVRLIVPFPAGGPTDSLARLIAQKLQDKWKQSVIVDNKPGAGTVIGTDAVAKAPADGLTLGMAISAYTINPSVRTGMPYNTLKDLTGVTQLAAAQMVLVAAPGTPFNTIPELVAYARAHPGKLSYASPGAGTGTHLAGELFKNAARIDIVHVPYKGSGPAQTDVIGGRVELMFDVLQSALPMVQSGRLKVIALTSARRDRGFPQYPVIGETIPGFEVTSMFGLIAPAGIPAGIRKRIQVDAASVVHSAEVTDKLGALGMVPVGSSPEAFNGFIQAEIVKWGKVVKANDIHIE
ncbi:tripartite tricarboxylate transporter substrate binding protein [Cupriavidus sp. 8B]